MKLLFINEGIFEPYKSPVEIGEFSYIYIYIYIREKILNFKNSLSEFKIKFVI